MSGSASTNAHERWSCSVCGNQAFRTFARKRTPYLDQSETYTILTCSACGHGEALGPRDSALLGRVYSESFFASSQQAIDDPGAAINLNAKERAAWLASFAGGRLLDVGAGKGAFLIAAQHKFHVEGIELSSAAAAVARERGLTVHIGDFESIALADAHYDVITFWDVLASLPNPVAAVVKARRLLRPGGHLVVTVPMIDSLAARLLRVLWPLLIPPVNLHYFSRRSIELLAAREGFVIVSVDKRSKRVALRFLAEKTVRSIGMAGLPVRFARLVSVRPVTIGTGDIATVVLQKPEGLAA